MSFDIFTDDPIYSYLRKNCSDVEGKITFRLNENSIACWLIKRERGWAFGWINEITQESGGNLEHIKDILDLKESIAQVINKNKMNKF